MKQKYWASEDKPILAKEILEKVLMQKKHLQKVGVIAELRKAYDAFFGNVHIEDVDQSVKAMYVNHFASYVRNIHSMVTGSRPAWEAQAVNTDLESQADTQLASGLLDYYMREKNIESILTEAVLKALYQKEAWVSLGWDVNGGEVYGVNPESGEPINEGDFVVKSHSMLDITRDIYKKDMKHDWFIVREYKNKWDLAAQYPELADKITAIAYDAKEELQYDVYNHQNSVINEGDSDLIPVYTLFHDRTPSMPNGRMTTVLSEEIVLFDGELPYEKVYLFPIMTGLKEGTGFGHSYLNDILPIQDAFNMTVSAILTNQAANAVQNFQVPKGASPMLIKEASGMQVWEYDPKAGKMERMDLLGTAPEVFNFAQFLIQQGDLISNVSQIGRGDAPANMSGTAMALLQQQAIQSTSGIQTSYTIALENVGTALIELLQTFAVVPRIALIAGKSKRSMMKQFSKDDLQGIGRVFVNRANPLTKTGAGRMEIANNLLATPGMISTPEQYLGVLTTGQLEPLYQRDNSQRLNILSENEELMEGKPVQALLTDNHPTHILEHSCVLDSPEARQNPKVIQATLDHIQEHLDLAKGMDPGLSAMLKQQSFYQPPQPPPQAGPPPGEPLPDLNNPGQLPEPAQPPNPNAFNQGVM